jgi:hypothetical protein
MVKRSARAEKRAGGPPARIDAGSGEFHPDYSYVRADLRRIAVLAAGFVSLLVLLSFLLD